MSPDDFLRRPKFSAGIGANSFVALSKFWDGDADLFFTTIETIFWVKGIYDE